MKMLKHGHSNSMHLKTSWSFITSIFPKVSALLLLIGVNFISLAQLDTIHYFPPMYGPQISLVTPTSVTLYLSTNETVPVGYTITDGTGATLQAGFVSNAAPVTFQTVGYQNPVINEAELHTVLDDKGYIVEATDSIYANMRILASNQASIVSGKGSKALGNEFRLYNTPVPNTHPSPQNHAMVGIMASEDNTNVSIDLMGTGVTLKGVGAPSTANVINITMNAGETYVLAAQANVDIDNFQGMIGSLLTSDKPVATIMGSWAGSAVNSGLDTQLDQPTPTNYLGDSFVLLEYEGSAAVELGVIIANSNGTDIFLNGSATAVATINAGDFYVIDGANFISGAMYIETSNPVYCWQNMSGGNNTISQGAIAIPELNCFAPKGVDLIPSVSEILPGVTLPGGLCVITYAGSNVLLNGAPIGLPPTLITGSPFEYYKVVGVNGNISIESSSASLVSIYGASNVAGFGGYYSGFDNTPSIQHQGVSFPNGDLCLDSLGTTSTLFTQDTNFTYQWYYNNTLIPGANNPSLIPSNIGGYHLLSTLGNCSDTSNTLNLIDCTVILPAEMGDLVCSSRSDGSGVELAWITTSEFHNDYFEILRSTDNVYWTSIGSIQGAGYSIQTIAYQFLDQTAPSGTIYYKIVQVDTDGTTTISNVCSSLNENASEINLIYDNGLLFVYTTLRNEQNFDIVNMQGQSVLDLVSVDKLSNKSIRVNLSNLSKGVYCIRNGNTIVKAMNY